MNVLAQEINSILKGSAAERLLSSLGRRLYFPKGIIAQSAEAKKNARGDFNATIGIAVQGGKPLVLSAISEALPALSPSEAVAYAPTAGVEQVRKAWKTEMGKKNPSLNTENISLPVVVPGLTAGISYIADLFLDEGDCILASDPCWDNYRLVITDRRGASFREIPFFGNGNGFDMDAISRSIREAAKDGAVRIILNFPNNPSGYAPTKAEADAFVALIKEIADKGSDVMVICDDAYFGLFYEDETYRESLFARLASLHERVLAIKVDGPTKEDYVWGLRMGFVTFGSAGLNQEQYEGLIKKLMGAIRSSVSCSNSPAQYLMLKTLEDKRTGEEKRNYYEILKKRYGAVKECVKKQADHPALRALPFNSGYFMSFRCKGLKAEELRQELLAKHGIGTIAFGDTYLRVAFSSVDLEKIPGLYEKIFETAAALFKAE
ncbi:aminotransferase class I/II-fold pyridoxal phosphate-dependent enzyme [Treponema sp. OttesenSCG-928-L16]|nr:aminotransferase class I/II-fold pyridoxal phosphate-dependent enzyme [Treponema sp. OttesenSCG-928-L16]